MHNEPFLVLFSLQAEVESRCFYRPSEIRRKDITIRCFVCLHRYLLLHKLVDTIDRFYPRREASLLFWKTKKAAGQIQLGVGQSAVSI